MDTNQLQGFIKVATLKNFTAAAQELYISQPTLSYQISSLEDEVGVRLIDRSRKKVELTNAGIAFLQGARNVLSLWEKSCIEAKQAANQELYSLRLGYIDDYFDTRLYSLIDQFRKDHPRVFVSLNRTAFSDLNQDTLLKGEFDLLFTHHIGTWPKDIFSLTLWEEELVIVISLPYLKEIGVEEGAFAEDVLSV